MKKMRQALPLAAATVRAVVGPVRLRGRTTRRRRRRQRLRPYVARKRNAAPVRVCGCHTAAAVAAVAGSVCRGRTLLRRAFGIDVLVCPKCAGPRRVLAAIHDPAAIARLLAALGLTAAGADP